MKPHRAHRADKRVNPPWRGSLPRPLSLAEKRRRLEWLRTWHERMGRLELNEQERR